MESWFAEFGADAGALVLSVLLVAAYYAYLRIRIRRDPYYTIHAINVAARQIWATDVMSNRGKDVMAVQTLRNFVMAATFMASTATLLIMGTLTLSGQAENLARTWHALNFGGSHDPALWTVKVICLLLPFIVAFFAFAMCVRLLNHVVFMLNLPERDSHALLSPRNVAHRLNRAGAFYSIGMRAFFMAVPLVFWLFGPVFLAAATVGLVITFYRLDRSPAAEKDAG